MFSGRLGQNVSRRIIFGKAAAMLRMHHARLRFKPSDGQLWVAAMLTTADEESTLARLWRRSGRKRRTTASNSAEFLARASLSLLDQSG